MQNLALQTTAELGTDIIILSKFYKYGKAHEQWQRDRSSRAAIAHISNLPIDKADGGMHDGFTWVTTGDIRVYSCHWSPNTTYTDFENFLRNLEASIRTFPVDVIVGGDFNAKHGYWSFPINDVKGHIPYPIWPRFSTSYYATKVFAGQKEG